MNILINNTVSYSKECMGMKSLHYFCENCVVYDLREIMTDRTHNERNQNKEKNKTTNDINIHSVYMYNTKCLVKKSIIFQR